MYQQLQKLFDLPNPNLALKEAQNKLVRTFLFLNGNLVYVEGFQEAGILCVTAHAGEVTLVSVEEVNSLDVWLPDTGVYFSKDDTLFQNGIFLERKALRQWRRSFATSFYQMRYLGYSFPVFDIDPTSRADFWCKADKIYYHNVEVGKIVKNKLICTKEIFAQEIKDWLKQGHYRGQCT